ncbi:MULTISPECIES: DUF5316 family protein [Anoxybacillaceae]|uniref:DUF5316 family protein n=1 Tax=Anoxybacillaceae TaxID=3120669 RepID=UPI00351BBF36
MVGNSLENIKIYLFIISGILILSSIVISGFSVSGDRMRANQAYEDDSDKKWRMKWTINLMIVSIPSILTLIFLHFFF